VVHQSAPALLYHSVTPYYSLLLPITPYYSLLLPITPYYSLLLPITPYYSLLFPIIPYYSLLLHGWSGHGAECVLKPAKLYNLRLLNEMSCLDLSKHVCPTYRCAKGDEATTAYLIIISDRQSKMV
jgi:hypothetical protein